MDGHIKLLAEAARNNQLLIFAGAGISIGTQQHPGLPTGHGLNEHLKKEFMEEQNLAELSLDQTAEYLEYKYGRNTLMQKLSQLIESVSEPTQTHRLLSEIPFEVFVTTNYDVLMEKALDEKNRKYQQITQDLDLTNLLKQKVKVFKIHGCIANNQDRIILSEFDYYSKFLLDRVVFRDILKAWLLTHTCLFIGYSLSDINLKNVFFDISLNMGVANVKGRYYSVQLNPGEAQTKLWEERGFRILGDDQNNFLDKLIERIEFGPFRKVDRALISDGDVKVGKLSSEELRTFGGKNGRHEQRMVLLSERKLRYLNLRDGDWIRIELNDRACLARVFTKISLSFADIQLPLVIRNLLSFNLDKQKVDSLRLKKFDPKPIDELSVDRQDWIALLPAEYEDNTNQISQIAIRALEHEMLGLNNSSEVYILSPDDPDLRIRAITSHFQSNPGRALIGVNHALKDVLKAKLTAPYRLIISK